MICGGAGARRPQSARVCSLVMGRLAEVAFRVQRLYQARASTCAKFGRHGAHDGTPFAVHRKARSGVVGLGLTIIRPPPDDRTVHIISAWKANKHDQKTYYRKIYADRN
jgi:hypothetical protein